MNIQIKLNNAKTIKVKQEIKEQLKALNIIQYDFYVSEAGEIFNIKWDHKDQEYYLDEVYDDVFLLLDKYPETFESVPNTIYWYEVRATFLLNGIDCVEHTFKICSDIEPHYMSDQDMEYIINDRYCDCYEKLDKLISYKPIK